MGVGAVVIEAGLDRTLQRGISNVTRTSYIVLPHDAELKMGGTRYMCEMFSSYAPKDKLYTYLETMQAKKPRVEEKCIVM